MKKAVSTIGILMVFALVSNVALAQDKKEKAKPTKTEKAVDKAVDETQKAAAKTGDAVEKAAKKVEKETVKAAKVVKEEAVNAADKVEKAFESDEKKQKPQRKTSDID
ncbi:MAG: hypothetical protein GC178_15475 [Flavobacteriales bacterium]|nr:hypothetical protein [Flavobacteriales bacterium]